MFALYSISVSQHLLPFVEVLARRMANECCYYYCTDTHDVERQQCGWRDETHVQKKCVGRDVPDELYNVPFLIEMMRNLDLLEKRNAAGRTTFYAAERWFKPPIGFLRLLSPAYFRMAWRFARCARSPRFLCLPMGVHAARDMARLLGLFAGDLRCLFRAPKVAFESRPGGSVVPLRQAIAAGVLDAESRAFAKRHGFVQIPRSQWGRVRPRGIFAKLRMWGYFVAPGTPSLRGEGGHALQIEHPPAALWVGRMLDLKRVGDLARACRPRPDLKRGGILLDLYGHGPEEARLRAIAEGCDSIRFHDFVPVAQVRCLMRAHDVYVLPSNGYEGWGAVVSEALEEGMRVLATVESGAGATLLPPSNLFCAGDVEALAKKLRAPIPIVPIGEWTAEGAAEAFLSLIAYVRSESAKQSAKKSGKSEV